MFGKLWFILFFHETFNNRHLKNILSYNLTDRQAAAAAAAVGPHRLVCAAPPATWKWKRQGNRPPPFQSDRGSSTLLQCNE